MNISRKAVFERVARKEITPEEARRILAAAPAPATGPIPDTVPPEPIGKPGADAVPAPTRNLGGPDDIAVVGMAARFPGAPDLTQFWANLLQGVDAVTEIPDSRKPLHDVYHPDPNHPGTSHSRWGSFIEGIDQFDPGFFNISAAEAEIMDPQQRLFLEAAWHALEDAGINPRALAGEPVGVFMGAKSTRYLDHFTPKEAGTQPLASRMLSVLPARLSYLLDLKGPGIIVDTECSSSLVAIHQACQALHSGECHTALAGGITLLLDPELFVTMSKAQMLSPNGRCRTFDAAADGIVMGEGLGIVVLKPLARALADRDAIYSVIRASVLNQDGKTNGITAPNTLSQTDLARASFSKAQLDPAQLGYMECHGTGTILGDPIEVGALETVFRERGAGDAKVPLGSIKTNFGHTLLAAGVAGFLKAALAVHHGKIPPSLHFEKENPKLELAQSPFFVADRVTEFTAPARYAGVSAFGASGTNSQILLGPAPAPPDANRDAGPFLFLFSGRSQQALLDNTARFAAWLKDHPDESLGDIAFTLAMGRTRFNQRLAVIATSAHELEQNLTAFAAAPESQNDAWWTGKAKTGHREPAVVALLKQSDTARRVPRAFHALLSRVAQAEVSGADLDLSALFPPARHRRVHLPGYVFQHARYWTAPSQAAATPIATAHDGHLVDLNAEAWYLRDHIINGQAVLPGVVHIHHFLEQARRRFDVADSRALHLENLNWAAPVVVSGCLSLQCQWEVDGADILQGTLQSDQGRHSQVTARKGTVPQPQAVEVAAVQAQCSERIDAATLYQTFADSGIGYGPGFKVVEHLSHNHDTALAALVLPEARRADDNWNLNPALLDGAFQTLAPLLTDTAQGETWLPFAVKRLTYFAPLPQRVWALAQAHQGGDGRLRRYELYLLDPDGTVLVHLHGFTVRAVGGSAAPATQTSADTAGTQLLEARRAPIRLAAGKSAGLAPVWVLQRSGAATADQLRAAGSNTVLAVSHAAAWSFDGQTLRCDFNSETDMLRLSAELAALEQPPAVFLDALDAADAPGEATTATWLDDAVRQRLALNKALWRLPQLRHTRFLYSYPDAVSPALEALAGWYRTLFREKPEWQARVVAWAGQPLSGEDIATLAAAPIETEREVFRDANGAWHGRRLFEPKTGSSGPLFQAGEHHLVTGGAGGIGRIVAEHLARHHQCKVTLMGRSPLKPATEKQLETWRTAGASVQYVRADVGDETTLGAALSAATNQFGPLNGLHHCAGLIRDNYMVRKPAAEVPPVLRPKVAGTLNLDRWTRDQPLRCFVLHSAVTAVLGNAGQSDYAVANRFLDAFAAHRNRTPAPGRCVAVNWPLWRDGGMNVPDEVWAAMGANAGVAPLESRDGLRHIEEALQCDADSLISCCAKNENLLGQYLRAQGCPIDQAEAAAAPTPAATLGSMVDAGDLETRVCDHLVQLVAAQTKIDPAQIDLDEEIDAFGLDSIGAMQITDQLERHTGSLPKTLFFEHPNLRAVATALCDHHAEALTAALGAAPAADPVSAAPQAAEPSDTATSTWSWLRELLAAETKIAADLIDEDAPLDELGLDSIMAMNLTGAMEERLGSLSKTLFFEHNTARDLVATLCRDHAAVLQPESTAENLPVQVTETPTTPQNPTPAMMPTYPVKKPTVVTATAAETRPHRRDEHDIAVIAVDGRYPLADDLDSFWQNLRTGRDCIREIPAERWNPQPFEDILRDRRSCKWGGFMDGIDRFDPLFFNIPPREADLLDPQERLLLETAWRTFENAGYARARLQDSQNQGQVGVYMATMYPEYLMLGLESALRGQAFYANSTFASFANRISYFFNLRGPSLTLDTMCSGSLTAVCQAVDALRRGACRMALAGGVSLILHPYRYVLLARGRFFAGDGRCRGFGEGGDGYVPGEGVGTVLLKRLADAQADGDPILAVIKGTAVNHGGRTNGYTVPNPVAQAELIQAALQDADLDPATISYVEAHGTGTALGDPIEIAGLNRAFGPIDSRPAMGTVKSNIGHLEPAAGIAGLTKVLLQMKHGELVPTLHTETPNRHINWTETPFQLQREVTPWHSDGPRRASISSFGAGGSNAHLILEAPPQAPAAIPVLHQEQPVLLVLSAQTDGALTRLAGQLAEHLRDGVSLVNLAWTLFHREIMPIRAALAVADQAALQRSLAALAAGNDAPDLWRGTVAPAQPEPAGEARDLRDAAQRFCAGGRVDGARFIERGTWLDLPNYPFEPRRCWVDFKAGTWPSSATAPTVTTGPQSAAHPLVGAGEPSLQSGVTFPISLDSGGTFMAEHRVRDQAVLPGVAMLEILRAACAALSPAVTLGEIHDLVWLQPLSAATATPVRLHLQQGEGQRILWRCLDGNNRPAAHGSLSPVTPAPPQAMQVAGYRERAHRVVDADFLYSFFQQHGLHYGPHFQTLRQLHLGNGFAVGRLHLQQRAGLPSDALPPGLLDGMLQSALGLVLDGGETPDLMVPFAIGGVAFYRPLPDHVDVVVEHVAAPQNGHLRFNATVVATDGHVCLRLRDVASRRLDGGIPEQAPQTHEHDGAVPEDCFVPFWSQESLQQPQPVNGPLVVLHRGRLGDVHAALQAAVAGSLHCHDLDAEPDLTDLVRRHTESREWLLVLPVPTTPLANPDAESLRQAEEQGVLTLLQLAKSLAAEGRIQGLRVRCVTHNLQIVAADERADVRYGAVPGLTKAMAHEFPGIRTLCADLAGNLYDNAAAAATTWRNLLEDPVTEPARETAWRQGLRFVKRLRPAALPNTGALPIQRGAVIVFFGGAGGLGVVFSKVWAERYGAHLVWVGRRAEDDDIRRNMAEVAALGGSVQYQRADMTDREALEQVRSAVRAAHGRIDGVIHSAIVMRDTALTGMSRDDFRAALDPKAAGTMAVEAVFGTDPQTWIAYFSSANGFMGNPGQGNYTAGCTFQDLAVAALARADKKRRWVIDWGYWGETGIVQDARYREQLAKIGIVPLRNTQGVAALDRILAGERSPVMAIRARAELLDKAGVRRDQHQVTVDNATAIDATRVNQALAHWQQYQQVLSLDAYNHLEREVAPAVYARLASRGLPAVNEPFTAAELATRIGLLPKYKGWLDAWLVDTAHQGLARWDGTQGCFLIAPPAAGETRIREVGARFEEVHAHAELLATAVAKVDAVVTGAVAATDVMFPNASMSLVEAIYRGNAIADFHNRAVCAAVSAAVQSADGRPVHILEVGAGTGGTSTSVLAELARLGAPVQYVYTDLGPGFVQYGKRTFGQYDFVRFQTYDLARDPAEQDLPRGGFDLVLAANVVHATADVMASLAAIKSLLKRGGLLVLNEVTSRRAFSNATFGLLDGWWLFNDAERRIPLAPALSPDQWSLCFGELGYQDMTVVGLPSLPRERLEQAVLVTRSDGCLPLATASSPQPAAPPPAAKPTTPQARVPAKRTMDHRTVLAQVIAEVLGCQAHEIHPTRPFSDFGVDSIVAVDLITRINETFSLNLRPTLLFDYNHLNSLADHLDGLVTTAPAPPKPAPAPPVAAVTPPAAPPTPAVNQDALRPQLTAVLAEVLGCRPEEIHPTRPFSDFGVDSIVAVDLITRINETFALNLRPTLLFDYNHLDSLADHLAAQVPAQPATSVQPATPLPTTPAAPAFTDPAQVLAALAENRIDIDEADRWLTRLAT